MQFAMRKSYEKFLREQFSCLVMGKDRLLIFAREEIAEKSRMATQLATATSLLLLRRCRRRAGMEKEEFQNREL